MCLTFPFSAAGTTTTDGDLAQAALYHFDCIIHSLNYSINTFLGANLLVFAAFSSAQHWLNL